MARRSFNMKAGSRSPASVEEYRLDSDQTSSTSEEDAHVGNEAIDVRWNKPRFLWRQYIPTLHLPNSLLRSGTKADAYDVCTECRGPKSKRGKLFHCLNIFVTGPLALLGIFQLIALIGGFISAINPTDVRPILSDWRQIDKEGVDLAPWPVDFTRDVRPVPCHSHNDYTRRLPLYSALSAGCVSVEADIWLVNGELYVGHHQRSLAKNRTLASLYIDPLLEILERQNSASDPLFEANYTSGVFSSDPAQGLTLLIDFKNSPDETWTVLQKALEPLRSKGYMSFWNGTELEQRPITVVGTGDTPFQAVISDTLNYQRDIFFDAPIDQMWIDPDNIEDTYTRGSRENGTFSQRNSYYASVSFGKSIGRMLSYDLTTQQMRLLRGQIKGAHARGLKVRYWSLPFWPISLRNKVWSVLIREGVDVLNVDDLAAATALDW